jgi:hypothetical protein
MSFCRWKGRCEEIQFMVMVNVPGEINVISEYDSSYLYLIRQATQKRKKTPLGIFHLSPIILMHVTKVMISASIKAVRPE